MPPKRRHRRTPEGPAPETHESRSDGAAHPLAAPESGSRGPGPGTPVAGTRLDVFIIDTGWNAPISTALLRNLEQIRVYLEGDGFYILDQAQSVALLKSNPHLIGHDPMILFLDRQRKDAGHRCYGLRLNLGLLRKPEQALARLQTALRIVAENRTTLDMYKDVEKELWKAGIDGAFKVIGEAALELA